MSARTLNRHRKEPWGHGRKGFAVNLRHRLFIRVATINKQLEKKPRVGTSTGEREKYRQVLEPLAPRVLLHG